MLQKLLLFVLLLSGILVHAQSSSWRLVSSGGTSRSFPDGHIHSTFGQISNQSFANAYSGFQFLFDPASTSVKDLQKFNFDILCYPNPSMKILNIQSVKEILAEGVLHNALGNVFYRFQINGNRSSIPVSEIPSGEYFITLYNTTHYFSKPIIVQH